MHTAPDPTTPITPPTPVVIWMADYSTVDILEYGFSPRVMNMFIAALNERISALADYHIKFKICPGPAFFGSNQTYGQLIPKINRTVPVTNFGLALNLNTNTVISRRAAATVVSDSGFTITYKDLDIISLVSWFAIAQSQNVPLCVWCIGERRIVTDCTITTITIDDLYTDKPTGQLTFSVDGSASFYDITKSVYGWADLQADVISLANYFVKNELADGSSPSKFFEYCNCVNSWAQSTDQQFTDFEQVPDWERNLIPYGPTDKYVPLIFRRKYPREITIADLAELQDDGSYLYSATISPLTNKLDGIILTKNKDGEWSDMTDPDQSIAYPELVPQVGQIARLVGDRIDPNNPAFSYYVKGLLFRYDGTSWIMTGDRVVPDQLSAIGPARKGDTFGAWILEDIRDCLNLYMWTFILNLDTGPVANSYRWIGPSYPAHNDLAFPFGLRLATGYASYVTRPVPGQDFFDLLDYNEDAGPLVVGSRLTIQSEAKIVTAIAGTKITFSPPMTTVHVGDSNSFIAVWNTECTGTITGHTRFQTTISVGTLSSIPQPGMRVTFGNFQTELLFYTAGQMVLKTAPQVEYPSGTLVRFFIDYPNYYWTDRGIAATDGSIYVAEQVQAGSPFNYLETRYSYNTGTDSCDMGDIVPRLGSPTAIWGPFPVFTGLGVYSIYGQNPDSREIPRVFDRYSGYNVIESEYNLYSYVPDLPYPQKVPKFKFTLIDRSPAILPEQDKANHNPFENLVSYTGFDQDTIAYNGIIICKWQFKYTKERLDVE